MGSAAHNRLKAIASRGYLDSITAGLTGGKWAKDARPVAPDGTLPYAPGDVVRFAPCMGDAVRTFVDADGNAYPLTYVVTRLSRDDVQRGAVHVSPVGIKLKSGADHRPRIAGLLHFAARAETLIAVSQPRSAEK